MRGCPVPVVCLPPPSPCINCPCSCYDILFSTPGPALQKQGVRHFITSAAIPIVGSTADKFWSWKYGSALIASDLQMGQSGVFVKGSMLTSKMPSSGDAVKLASVPKSI